MARLSNKIDVVYPVQPTRNGNAELRYSLRSLKNMPHGKVHIFSDRIPWLSKEIVWHPSSDKPGRSRFANVNETLLRACNDPNVSDPFVFMNDDFYVMKPITDLPYYCNGTLQQHWDYLHQFYTMSKYMRDLLETQSVLKEMGYGTIDFEVHAPILFYKDKLKEVLTKFPNTACRRTIYGNLMEVPYEQVIDFKIYGFGDFDKDREFVSSSNGNFDRQSVVRSLVRSAFTEPSKYER